MSNERELLNALINDDDIAKRRIIDKGDPVDMMKLFKEVENINKELTEKMFKGLVDPIH